MAPQGAEDIVASLAQALKPGTLGQGAQDTGGDIFVPSACTRQLMSTSTPKEGGTHEAKDFAQQLLLRSQAAFDLDDEVSRQAQVIEGLTACFESALGLSWSALMAFLRIEAAPFDDFRVLVSLSSGTDHGGFLRRVRAWTQARRKPCPKSECYRHSDGNREEGVRIRHGQRRTFKAFHAETHAAPL
jgi:hypothetical protein